WLAHRVQRPGEKINHALVLGGAPKIGKDTLLEPVVRTIGEWNFQNIKLNHLIGKNNSFFKSPVPVANPGPSGIGPQSRRPNSPLPCRYGRKPGIAVFIGGTYSTALFAMMSTPEK